MGRIRQRIVRIEDALRPRGRRPFRVVPVSVDVEQEEARVCVNGLWVFNSEQELEQFRKEMIDTHPQSDVSLWRSKSIARLLGYLLDEAWRKEEDG